VGEVQVHDADASSEPGCSRDHKQPRPDDDGPDGSRDALTGRCETFDGDGCAHHSHRAKVHDADDQEDRHQTGTALAAVEPEAQAVSPGRAGVGRQRTAAPGCLPAADKVTRLHAVSWGSRPSGTTTTAWARHLVCCREAPGRGRTLPADAGTAWRHGLRLGLHCSQCCAGLMAILLVIGVMDLRAMAVVGTAIAVERLAPAGERVARTIGAVVVGAGLFVIARAAGLG